MDIRLSLSLPRDAGYVPLVRRIAEALLDQACAPAVGADATLVLSEACAGAVRHAGVEEYTISLSIDGGACEIEIIDVGPGFDLARSAPAADGLEEAQRADEGAQLLRALIDDLRFERDRSGMRVRLIKRFHADEPVGTSPAATALSARDGR